MKSQTILPEEKNENTLSEMKNQPIVIYVKDIRWTVDQCRKLEQEEAKKFFGKKFKVIKKLKDFLETLQPSESLESTKLLKSSYFHDDRHPLNDQQLFDLVKLLLQAVLDENDKINKCLNLLKIKFDLLRLSALYRLVYEKRVFSGIEFNFTLQHFKLICHVNPLDAENAAKLMLLTKFHYGLHYLRLSDVKSIVISTQKSEYLTDKAFTIWFEIMKESPSLWIWCFKQLNEFIDFVKQCKEEHTKYLARGLDTLTSLNDSCHQSDRELLLSRPEYADLIAYALKWLEVRGIKTNANIESIMRYPAELSYFEKVGLSLDPEQDTELNQKIFDMIIERIKQQREIISSFFAKPNANKINNSQSESKKIVDIISAYRS